MGGDAALKKIYDRRLPVSSCAKPGDVCVLVKKTFGWIFLSCFKSVC